MQNSAIKILRSWLDKKDIKKLSKKINKKTIFTSILLLFIFVVSYYLVKPYFYNYNSNKKLIEKEINKDFRVNLNISGKISYSFLPTPRLKINKISIDFKNKNNKVFLEELNVLFSPFNNHSLNNLNFKKLVISKEEIKIYPEDFKNYFEYFTKTKNKDVIINDSTLFFLDEQNNKVFFENLNYKEKFDKNLHTIDVKTIFSENNLKIKFKNIINGEKNLDIKIPKIDSSINIVFDSSSNLNNLKGKSKIKLADNILVLNFEGKEKYKIYKSFLRNKFINSKIDGNISLTDDTSFSLKLDINQINFRKLLLNFFPEEKNINFLDFGISKKVNGNINVHLKNTNSFIGRINDFSTQLIFENGDLRIQNGSVILPNKSKVNFNLFYTDNSNDPYLDFNINFYSENTNKFLRKFNIYDSNKKEISILFQGKINLLNNTIKFKNIILNKREKLNRKDIITLEKNFNKLVLDDGIFGITDFFKLKKFAYNVLN